MRQKDFVALLDQIQEQERTVRGQAQKEYAHDDNDAFANFNRIAKQLNMTPEQVLWVYMTKHYDGILAHINGHKSQREDIRGRIKDARMYLALLWGMVEEKMPEEPDEEDYYPPMSAAPDPLVEDDTHESDPEIDSDFDRGLMDPIVNAMLNYREISPVCDIELSGKRKVRYRVTGKVTELIGDWARARKGYSDTDVPIRTMCPVCLSTDEFLLNGAICHRCIRETTRGPKIYGDPQYTRSVTGDPVIVIDSKDGSELFVRQSPDTLGDPSYVDLRHAVPPQAHTTHEACGAGIEGDDTYICTRHRGHPGAHWMHKDPTLGDE